ncbi:hypothetical protein [Qipengyuania sp. RANM35]|uniref:hypothetical protein n=1 Tax=Qipengyuania sp. RANM35 TaxID=3068635 RepID=UPI0034DAF9FF
MIDYFALGLTHALIMIALARTLVRPDLDREEAMADEAQVADEPAERSKRRSARRRRDGAGA